MEEQNKIIGQFDKKKNPFKVPDNYFDDFSAQLEKKLEKIEVAPAPVVEEEVKLIPEDTKPKKRRGRKKKTTKVKDIKTK